MKACFYGHEQCVRALLEAEFDPNKVEEDGWTALMFAAQNGHDECESALLEVGADLEKTLPSGSTALILAAQVRRCLCLARPLSRQ